MGSRLVTSSDVIHEGNVGISTQAVKTIASGGDSDVGTNEHMLRTIEECNVCANISSRTLTKNEDIGPEAVTDIVGSSLVMLSHVIHEGSVDISTQAVKTVVAGGGSAVGTNRIPVTRCQYDEIYCLTRDITAPAHLVTVLVGIRCGLGLKKKKGLL